MSPSEAITFPRSITSINLIFRIKHLPVFTLQHPWKSASRFCPTAVHLLSDSSPLSRTKQLPNARTKPTDGFRGARVRVTIEAVVVDLC